MAAVQRKPVAAPAGVSFGKLADYSSGGGLAEGDYALEFQVMNYQATKASGAPAGPPRLGVMVTAYNLKDPTQEPKTQFYSMGSNADKSYAPNPETGKGLVPVPGGAGASLNNQTNWYAFYKSMVDCDPAVEEVFDNDLSVLDGIHVHIHPIPEPEERKGFRSATSEAAEAGAQVDNRPKTIAVVSDILARPWVEGEGAGIPEAGAAPAPKAATKAAAKPATRPAAARPAPAPAPEPEAGGDDEALMEAAVAAITVALTTTPDGCPQQALRTKTFAAAKKAGDEATATSIIDTFFASTDELNRVLEQLGYVSDGRTVKVAA